MNAQRSIYWRPWQEPGIGHLSLTVTPDGAQRYTCIEPRGTDGRTCYRYEGPFRNFTTELPVDGDGLVIDYPETFARVRPS